MSSGDMDFLLPEPGPKPDTYRWATVTGVSPTRIRLDGEPEPLASTPVKLVPVAVGNRVWVQFHGRALVILGVSVPE